MPQQFSTFGQNYYSVLAEDDVVSGVLRHHGDCVQASLNSGGQTERCPQTISSGFRAVARYPLVNSIDSATVCVLKSKLLLGSSMTIDDYILEQIEDEIEKYRRKDEGWTRVGKMDETELGERLRKQSFYEYVHKMLTDRVEGYIMYTEYPDHLYNYIFGSITGVMTKMGIHLDYRLYKADTLEYFEREVPLAARNSQEAKALKKVWVDIYLSDKDRGMCDMIRNLILPIFVAQRMAELHKLKRLYIDYRQQLYRYKSFERLDDDEMKIQDFEFIEPIDGWESDGDFNDDFYY